MKPVAYDIDQEGIVPRSFYEAECFGECDRKIEQRKPVQNVHWAGIVIAVLLVAVDRRPSVINFY